jgi:hypothetical protein
MDLAVVLSERKPKYAPIATGLIEASKDMSFDIRYHGDDLKGYKNIILFDNRAKRVNGEIDCDKSANVGWWMCDFRAWEDLDCKQISPKITHIFVCSTELLDNYRKNFGKKTYYLPQCGYKFKKAPNIKRRKSNIIFIGSTYHPKYHTNRLEYFFALRKYGFNHIFRGKTSYDMSRLYKETPISLSISMPFRGYTSNRLYNILAAGGFCLSLYYPEMEKQFTNREHLVWFKNVKEAINLAGHYLGNTKERNRIAENGRKLFLEKHTPRCRVQNMFDIMEGKTQEFYGYL